MQSSLRPQSQDFISEYLIAFLIVIVLFAWATLTEKGSERHLNSRATSCRCHHWAA
jgi:hypothetical protein